MFTKDLKLFVCCFCFYSQSACCTNHNSVWGELCHLQSTSHAHLHLNFGRPGARQHGRIVPFYKWGNLTPRVHNVNRGLSMIRGNSWVKNAELFLPLKMTEVVSFINILKKVVDDSVGGCGKRGLCAWSLWVGTMETKTPLFGSLSEREGEPGHPWFWSARAFIYFCPVT